ncbi:P-loop containing nucleoside triphosphate hydrolase protein [Nemania sp. FL0031]|nr:P-loop containing nucleoside triphosphate hydrolase protein [Nemania sp. FL0031]
MMMSDKANSLCPADVTQGLQSHTLPKAGIIEPPCYGDGLIGLDPVGPRQQPIPSLTGRQLSLDDVEAVHVELRDLSITLDTSPSLMEPATYPDLIRNVLKPDVDIGSKKKTLLNCINASFKPGTLTAILGGSGSGKTTLLNTMADRVFSPRLSKTGLAAFNKSISINSIRHAYVMQQDVLLPTLTVRETLRYAADLRLPPPATDDQRARIVEEVILELGLKDCADTRIGNSQHRGCSGGEKRRTSIGVQLLANPSVLFLDEPTTGLDATSAYRLVQTLKDLSLKGRTIIATLHSPRSEIWDLLDNLILLSKGSLVYSGSTQGCIPWFSSLGYELPPFVNPAEFAVDHAAIDNRTPELEEESIARVRHLKVAWVERSQKITEPLPLESTQHDYATPNLLRRQHHAGLAHQIKVLTSRTFKVTYRDPLGMAGSILEVIFMAAITGYIFYNLGRDLPGIRSRQGALYISIALQGYLFLTFEIYRMSLDILAFDREKSEGCVTALPFILSRRIARLFTEDIPVPFLYSVFFYFLAGFEPDARKFFTFFAVLLLNHYISVTLATACIAAVRHFPGASLIANLAYTLQSLACGFFIQSNTIPIYVRWTKYITYSFYGFGSLCSNEFEGSFYDCPLEGGAENPACVQYTGRYILDNLGLPRHWISRPIIAMLGFVFLFILTSWIGLAFINVEMTIARSRTSGTDFSTGKEKMIQRPMQEARTIDVSLDKFALRLEKRSALGKPLPTKVILQPITTTFQAGMLNTIMGPSGSGKTSLLSAMAQRINNTIGTKYRSSGRLLFNGAVPSSSVIRSVVSYVCQDDDALLPSLTVRETLRFAAGLRLPSWMSTQEKYERAEEVLLNMGLKDCADNLIGSDIIKGISGGEKRRVSIAVQILTDPRVLLLDEPTSGLDAFTASSITGVLQGLANEGRTIILTIHQARSDLFRSFGNVLLLARGGSLIYSGLAGGMLEYFGTLHHHCPQHTNPADFALDLITVNLQEEQRETESRGRVRKLIESWSSVAESSQPVANILLPRLSMDGGGIRPSQILASEHRDSKSGGTNLKANEDGDDERGSQGRTDRAGSGRPSLIPTPNKTTLVRPAELGALVRKRASFRTAFPLLLRRATINLRRQPPLLLARTFQVIGLAIVLALFFAPLHHDYYSIQNRVGFVQEICAFYFVGMLQNVAIYPAEREVFYREDDDAVYSIEAFLATYTILEVPFEIVSCLVFGVLADFAVGFPRTAELYFVLVFCAFGIVSCGESLGIMFNTVFNHTGFAVNIVSILLSVAQVIAGLISIEMPRVFEIFNYLSPTKYAVAALARFSLDGVMFTCDAAQRLPDGHCTIETGKQVLQLYNLDVNGVTNLAALAGTVLVYRLVAWLLLRLVRTKENSIVKLRRQSEKNNAML